MEGGLGPHELELHLAQSSTGINQVGDKLLWPLPHH